MQLQVREKAVDVIVGLVDVLGIDAVFEKLKVRADAINSVLIVV